MILRNKIQAEINTKHIFAGLTAIAVSFVVCALIIAAVVLAVNRVD